jgi:hypothetical protein
MKTDLYFEKVYELLEQSDFKDLPEKDRIYVLSGLTESEFNEMRGALQETEAFFSNACEPVINGSLLNSTGINSKSNFLIKLLNRPVKFYQLAASILLILGLLIIKQYSDSPVKNSAIPVRDTLNIDKSDSLSSKLADTVKNIREKIVFISRKNNTNNSNEILSTAKFAFDSDNFITSSNIARIRQLPLYGDTSGETLYKN